MPHPNAAPVNVMIELPLIRSGRKPIIFMIVILSVLLIALIGAAVVAKAKLPQGAAIPPQIWLAVAVFCLLPFVLMRIIGKAGAFIDHGDLVMQTGVGKKRVPLSHLRKHGVEVIDLTQHPELKPLLRFWGTNMPGLTTGWFRLRNGEKAVCLLTDHHRVTYLRSDTDNLSLLLSLQNPGVLKTLLDH